MQSILEQPSARADILSEKAYADLVEAVLGHAKDVPARIEVASHVLGHHPRFHGAKAFFLSMLARSEMKPAALACAQKALALAADFGPEEHQFARAAVMAAEGHWRESARQLDVFIQLNPSDSLSIKLGHGLRFMLGDKAGMLSSIEAALARFPADHPHLGYLMGCHAFALEENRQYARAEAVGREAVARQPRDAWGLHAVSHVHEMTGRVEEGIAWIEGHEARLRRCNNFGGHLFWHLALFYLEQGEIGQVFALYDREIRRERTDDFRDIANAASLLSRLQIAGHAVGDRWEELADIAETRIGDRALVFADLHYMLALMGAGRSDAIRAYAWSMRNNPASYADQNDVARAVGVSVAGGLEAFAEGKPDKAFAKLHAVRADLTMIGGSDAQRDVFEQILLESALQADETRIAGRYLEARLIARGGRNQLARAMLVRAGRQMPKRRGSLAVLASMAFPRLVTSGGN